MASWEDRFIRILEKDEWVVDYDREKKKYRVSYFEEFHFCDEIWFDAYEDKEVDDRIEKIIEKLENVKQNFKIVFGDKNPVNGCAGVYRVQKSVDANGMVYLFDKLIEYVKELK